jgi:CubicO group peptidase (beta-lactamase class C family)
MRTARIMTVLVLTVGRHTAGFAYGGYFEVTPVDRAYRDAGIVYAKLDSLDELVRKLSGMPLLYEPGERWVYSFAAEDYLRFSQMLLQARPHDKWVATVA